MHRFKSVVSVFIAPTLLLACGGVQGEDDPEMDPELEVDGGSTSEPGEAPLVVSVSPANGDIGVAADEVITVVFDQPMNQASVEAAWTSEDIGAVSFEWNASGDTLTVIPDEPLALAQGRNASPKTLEALRFAFTIAAGATDVDGEVLEKATTVEFATLRRFFIDLTPIGELTRTRRADGVVFGATALQLTVGDTSGNLQTKSFASFDLPNLPAGALVEAATFTANQTSTINTPYVLGDIDLFHVNAAVIDAGASANALAEIGPFSTSATTGTRALDVTAFFVDDLDNRAARGETTQFRLEFPTGTNSNAVADEARFTRSGFELEVAYLLE